MAAAPRQPAPNAHAKAPQPSTEGWMETVEEIFATLGIPALDPKLWDRTLESEMLKVDVLSINPGDEKIIEERLLQFFEQKEGKFYCRLPINDTKTGQSYCDHALGRKNRILGHLRAHLNFRPLVCGGDCGNPSCAERFCEDRYRSQHINPDKVNCRYCRASLYRQNLGGHIRTCERNPARIVA